MTSRRRFLCSLAGGVTAAFATGRLMAADAGDKVRIEALIRHVEGLKGVRFIRNGREYDAASAARFLRGKWQARDGEIRTAEDFIRKVASVSSTTGKPYLIRFPDGREERFGDYLRARLARNDG